MVFFHLSRSRALSSIEGNRTCHSLSSLFHLSASCPCKRSETFGQGLIHRRRNRPSQDPRCHRRLEGASNDYLTRF
jgi:hypothetical protein